MGCVSRRRDGIPDAAVTGSDGKPKMTALNLSIESRSYLFLGDLTLLWSLANYAVLADPVQETRRTSNETQRVPLWWPWLLAARSLAVGGLAILIAGISTGSLVLGFL